MSPQFGTLCFNWCRLQSTQALKAYRQVEPQIFLTRIVLWFRFTPWGRVCGKRGEYGLEFWGPRLALQHTSTLTSFQADDNLLLDTWGRNLSWVSLTSLDPPEPWVMGKDRYCHLAPTAGAHPFQVFLLSCWMSVWPCAFRWPLLSSHFIRLLVARFWDILAVSSLLQRVQSGDQRHSPLVSFCLTVSLEAPRPALGIGSVPSSKCISLYPPWMVGFGALLDFCWPPPLSPPTGDAVLIFKDLSFLLPCYLQQIPRSAQRAVEECCLGPQPLQL